MLLHIASSTSVPNAYPKQLAAIRRRSGLTHKEYLYYNTMVHGLKAHNAPNDTAKPLAYYQNHVFDGVFGVNDSVPVGSWAGRDNVVELYSRESDSFTGPPLTNYTQTVIGPDGVNFNDLPTAFSMVAFEKFTTIPLTCAQTLSSQSRSQPLTAFFWAGALGSGPAFNNITFAQSLVNYFTGSLLGSIYNISSHTVVAGTDSSLYYGGANMPVVNAVIKFWLCDADKAVDAVRQMQKNISSSLGINEDTSFMVFSKSVALWDETKNIKVNIPGQPGWYSISEF